MTLVVDASVAVKWVLLEPDSSVARALPGTDTLIAPEFLRLECANVLAQQVRRGFMAEADAASGLRLIDSVGVRHSPDRGLVDAARRLAIELGRSAYDSLYLALALTEGAVLVTADARFAAAVEAAPAYRSSLRRL